MKTNMTEVTYLPIPTQLNPEQRVHWREQAAYWACREEDAMLSLEYAHRQRENALRMLGMLGVQAVEQG